VIRLKRSRAARWFPAKSSAGRSVLTRPNRSADILVHQFLARRLADKNVRAPAVAVWLGLLQPHSYLFEAAGPDAPTEGSIIHLTHHHHHHLHTGPRCAVAIQRRHGNDTVVVPGRQHKVNEIVIFSAGTGRGRREQRAGSGRVAVTATPNVLGCPS
jgi:hypothetical protein